MLNKSALDEMAAAGATLRGMKAGALEFNVEGTPEDPGVRADNCSSPLGVCAALEAGVLDLSRFDSRSESGSNMPIICC